MAERNRVYELAKAHGVTSKALLGVLQELGVVAKSHMSVLTDEDVELVDRHFAQLEAKGERVVERSQRVEVEKARPKPKRLSAREKLAAKRKEREARRKTEAQAPKAPEEAAPAAATTEAPAAEPARPRLEKVKVFKPTELRDQKEPMAEAAPPDEAPSGDSGEAAGKAATPAATQPAAKREASPEEVRSRTVQRPVDLSSVAKAAARTRAKIADETRTRMAGPETHRPQRRRSEAPRSGAPVEDEARQPRPIDPNAIRTSVRRALGGMSVPRRRGGEDREKGRPLEGIAGAGPRGRRRGSRQIREEKREKVARHRAREEALQVKENELRITEFITVQELAEKLSAKPQDLIVKLMGMGVMATMNQRLEKDQIEILVSDYEGIDIKWLDASSGEDVEFTDEAAGEPISRSPVVTVMGHVDHGKTTLLDHLRKTNVTEGEAGGITQHIGAYRVETPRGAITFLDTPGHQAFTAMRARGARVTDIVVIVVAADDKVMPQTVEAIDHARASNCPIVIAINKIDLPGADPAGVKQQLMQHNVLVEEFGGDVQSVEISAKKGVNVDALLEAVMLQAELMELKSPADGLARGSVVEARKDVGRGPVFTALVTQGTLRVGDPFVVGKVDGRVRAMLDEFDQPVKEAGPSQPVLVLGANEVPEAGDPMHVVHSDSEAREIAGRRRVLQREAALHAPRRKASLETFFDRMQEQEAVELNLLIKGDVAGSVEALCDALMALSTEKVQVNVIHRGVGGINENDVLLAATSDAIIIGFHLRPDPHVRRLAKEHNVEIRLYDIIYETVEDVKAAMKGMLAPVEKEVAVGSAEVRELFRVPKVGVIAGSYVLEGEVRRNGRVRVVREQVQVYQGTIGSLKRFKDDARSVTAGYECGIGVDGFDDLKIGDILEVFEVQQVAQEM